MNEQRTLNVIVFILSLFALVVSICAFYSAYSASEMARSAVRAELDGSIIWTRK